MARSTPVTPKKESDLYLPIKALLERQGYEVKGEVKGCDVLARRDKLLVAVELKLILNLTVVLQANERADTADFVYIATLRRGAFYKTHRKSLIKLLRKLGFGLILVNDSCRTAEAVLDPLPYVPRKQAKKRERLIKEFDELIGDPNVGGSASRIQRVTVYRQKAVHIARFVKAAGCAKASAVRDALHINNARDIMYQNHYGWFEREGKGMYRLSKRGCREIQAWENLPADTNTSPTVPESSTKP